MAEVQSIQLEKTVGDSKRAYLGLADYHIQLFP